MNNLFITGMFSKSIMSFRQFQCFELSDHCPDIANLQWLCMYLGETEAQESATNVNYQSEMFYNGNGPQQQ